MDSENAGKAAIGLVVAALTVGANTLMKTSREALPEVMEWVGRREATSLAKEGGTVFHNIDLPSPEGRGITSTSPSSASAESIGSERDHLHVEQDVEESLSEADHPNHSFGEGAYEREQPPIKPVPSKAISTGAIFHRVPTYRERPQVMALLSSDETTYRNIFDREPYAGDINQMNEIINRLRDQAEASVFDDQEMGREELFEVIRQSNAGAPIILVGHTDHRDGVYRLKLPAAEQYVSVAEIEKVAKEAEREVIILTCFANSLEVKKQIRFADINQLCEDAMVKADELGLDEGYRVEDMVKHLKSRYQSIQIKRTSKFAAVTVVVGTSLGGGIYIEKTRPDAPVDTLVERTPGNAGQ